MKKIAFFSLFSLSCIFPTWIYAGPSCGIEINITISPSNDGSVCDCSGDVASVSNCNLEGAIQVASWNSGKTTINLETGTYSPASTLDYYGGYGSTLILQAVSGASPVIDGAENQQIMSATYLQSDLTVEGITFKNGSAADNGGALFIEADTGASFNVTLKNNSFINNKTPLNAVSPSGTGGAIFMNASTTSAGIINVLLEGNLFQENQATYGGGIYLNTVVSSVGGSVTLKGNTWTGNQATYDDGALGIEGSTVTMGGRNVGDGNIIQNNKANQGGDGGGAIFAVEGITFVGNSVLSNHADQAYVGGLRLFNQGGVLDVEYNLVDSNTSGRIGGLQLAHYSDENAVS